MYLNIGPFEHLLGTNISGWAHLDHSWYILNNCSETLKKTLFPTLDEGDDYVGIHDIFTFAPGQEELQITIEIIDDDDWEPDEEFFLKIAVDPDSDNKDLKIGKKNIMTIMILNDDEPGTFGFDKRGHFVKVWSFLIR